MIRTWSMKNVVNPPGQIRDVCHHICYECETVAHCSKNGCIPKIPNEVMISDLARDEYNRLGHEEYFRVYYPALYDAALLNSDGSCFRNKGMRITNTKE